MFYKHKYKEMQRRMAEAQGKMESQRKYIRDLAAQINKLRDDYNLALKASEKMSEIISERNALYEENVTLTMSINSLKRELNVEVQQKEEFSDMLSDMVQRSACPSDCANRVNYRGCHTCSRNPKAVDKYVQEVSE